MTLKKMYERRWYRDNLWRLKVAAESIFAFSMFYQKMTVRQDIAHKSVTFIKKMSFVWLFILILCFC